MKKFLVPIAAVLIVGVAIGTAYLDNEGTSVWAFRTAIIERGNLSKTVSASGEVNSVITVEVGSEISGQISDLLVDFNSIVTAGQVIARIDPESFQAEVLRSEAELAVARATIMTKRAAITQAEANLLNARSVRTAQAADVDGAQVSAADLKRDYDRKRELRAKGVVALSQVDKAKAAWQAASAQAKSAGALLSAQHANVVAREAQVTIARAEVTHAEALTRQKEASLNIAKVNLQNTFIRSPVDGVVIGRNIDIGQTVAASFQAPTLFTIAQDLRKMQVETNIDEADIGQVTSGQSASFTVDSFPGRTFPGRVTQVRKEPLEVQNVVTYTVVLNADNSDLRLLPGMTAAVVIKVSDQTGVLKIPNAALRFTPPGMKVAPVQSGAATARRGPSSPQVIEQRRVRAQLRLDRLAKQLDLTETQKGSVSNLGRQLSQRLSAMRRAGTRGPEFRQIMAQMRRENRDKIMTFLTPAQRVKFKKILAERRSNPLTPARVWVLEDGVPKAVQIMIGAGDGKFTVMGRGAITEGQEVLVGVKPQTKKTSTFLARYGF